MRTVPSGREPRGFRRASLRPKSLEDDLKSWPCLLREECWQVGWWRGVGATLRHEQPRPLTWAPCFRALCCDLSLHLAPQSKGSIGGNCHAPQEPMSPPQTRQQGPRVLPEQTEPASLSSRPYLLVPHHTRDGFCPALQVLQSLGRGQDVRWAPPSPFLPTQNLMQSLQSQMPRQEQKWEGGQPGRSVVKSVRSPQETAGLSPCPLSPPVTQKEEALLGFPVTKKKRF